MNGYMTNGSYDFLNKLKEKHNIFPFILMHNTIKAVAYYEDTSTSIFALSRNFEILNNTGFLEEFGFISLTHISVTEEGRPLFEWDYKEKVNDLATVRGIVAARVLRPKKGNNYILLIEWEDHPMEYESWEKIDPSHQEIQASYIASDPYSEIFQVGEVEEEEED